ncbi:MAG: imidazole glycerol phosphate synthase subunit HisF [Anaerolineales bacterium]|nr:imidazole glycerol phosphate synthase subunit HisF [Anaerolineales bacterium]
MIRPRVIPCLLLKNEGLVKTVKFKDPKYLGDPINIVRIFNDKEVDELIFLDITATNENRRPNFTLLEKITSECFMPLGYGGGIRDMDDIKQLLKIGVEKIVLNTTAVQNPSLIREAANYAGSQAVVISVDIKKSLFGKYETYIQSGKKNTKLDPVNFAVEMEKQGAGEIFINSIDHDGTMQGYDVELIKRMSSAINIPLVACGGAGNIQHLSEAIQAGASAASAGSMFVFQGPLRGVLISYPTQEELRKAIP